MAQKNNGKLRIGIVGAGNIVRTRHLPALKKNPDVEIVAVSNSTYESSEQFCKEHCKGATPMANWADLLAVPDLDIIWIGTPPYMHSAVTISALEAGKHVFCQARMAMDLAEAEEMLATTKRFPELVTMLCPPPYGMRADLLVKKMLAENAIGTPHAVRLQSFTGVYLNPEAPAHWRQKIEISGLNVLTLGIYVEVLQRWLGDITGVFARGKILNAERRGYRVIVPDMLNVLCVFENGAEGVLVASTRASRWCLGARLSASRPPGISWRTMELRAPFARGADEYRGKARLERHGYERGLAVTGYSFNPNPLRVHRRIRLEVVECSGGALRP